MWIAATLGEQRVTKRYAAKAEIVGLCTSISAPSAPFALRLSAQLMLGVTRVFARKSDIVLSDSNALLQALQKHSASAAGFQGRGAATRGFVEGSITLDEANPGDAFNRITLPAHRKRKRGQRSGNTAKGDQNDSQRSNAVTSLAVALRGDPTSIDLPPSAPWMESQMIFDLEGAMEMAFPSISPNASGDPSGTVQQESNNSFSGSLKGARGENKASGSTYRARQEDITLLQDQNRITDSDLMRGSQTGEELIHYSFMAESGIDNPLLVGTGRGGGSSSLLAIPLQDDAAEEDFKEFGFTKFAKSSHGSVDRTGDFRPQPELGSYDMPFPGEMNAKSKSATPVSNHQGSSVDEDDRCQKEGATDQKRDALFQRDTTGIVLNTAGVSGTKPPKPPRRGTKMTFDKITEMPTSYIRECLNNSSATQALADSSETRAKKMRRIAPRRAEIEFALLSNPFIGSRVADELKELWNEVVVKPELDVIRRTIEQNQHQSKKDGVTEEQGDTRDNRASPNPGTGTPSLQTPQAATLDDTPQMRVSDSMDVQPTEIEYEGAPDAFVGVDRGQENKGPSSQPRHLDGSETAIEPEKLRDRVFETVRLPEPIHLLVYPAKAATVNHDN